MVLLVWLLAEQLWIGRIAALRAFQRCRRRLPPAENPAARGPSCVSPNAAAQTRRVSVARIQLDSRKSVRPFKAIIWGGISECAMSGLRNYAQEGPAVFRAAATS